MEHHLLTLIVLVAAAGVASQWLAWRLGLPAIVVLLTVGFLVGPVAGLMHPERDFGALLRPAISAAVAIIVFEGGLSLNFAEVRAAGQGIWRMIAIGVPLGWLFGATAAHVIGGLSWPISILLGAMLVITGPTVIQPLLRQARLARRPAAFLKWEGVLNDAIGAIISVLVLEFLLALGARAEVESTVLGTLVNLGLGLIVGGGLGLASAFLMRLLFARAYAPGFLEAPMVLATALLIYGLADLVQAESGLIAVALFGVGLANMNLPEIEELKRFKEGLSVFLVSGLFIVITADLPQEVFEEIGAPELAFIAAVLLLVRPAAILLATVATDMSWRERLFVAFIAPRGIVVAALAGLASTRLGGAWPEATLIVPLVFAIIVTTVVLHGFLMGPFARALGLASARRPGLAIVGSNAWTVALAQVLEALDTPVLVSDPSPEALREAHRQDLSTHTGHILAPTDDGTEQLKDVQFLLAATGDAAFDALVCLRFAPDLGQQHVYQTAFSGKGGMTPDLDRQWRGKILIGEDMTIDRLLDRLAAGWRFAVEEVKMADDTAGALRNDPDRRLPIVLVKPGGELTFASPESELASTAGGRLVTFRAPEA